MLRASSARVAALPRSSSFAVPETSRWLILLGVLWLLVGPRLQLSDTPDLRYEDLVFLMLAVLVVEHFRSVPSRDPSNLGVAAVVVTGVTAALIGAAAVQVYLTPSLLFAIRPLEYWIVFPAVALLLQTGLRRWTARVEVAIAIVTVIQVAFAVLQVVLHVPIGFSRQTYERGAGVTAGPYELGAICAALLIFWLSRRRWALAALSVVGLLLSVSRNSLLGAFAGVTVLVGVTVVSAVMRRRRNRHAGWAGPVRRRFWSRPAVRIVSAALVVVAALTGAGALTPLGRGLVQQSVVDMGSRLTGTSITGSWEAAGPLAEKIRPINTSDGYRQIAYREIFQHVPANDAAALGAESSNLIRFFRWHLILDNVNSPMRVIFGFGPSWAGKSVDGAFLRFFADAGLVGLVAWLFLLATWLWRRPAWMVAVAVTFVVGASFIDIVYAMRPMVLLWTLLALSSQARWPTRRGEHLGRPDERMKPPRSVEPPATALSAGSTTLS